MSTPVGLPDWVNSHMRRGVRRGPVNSLDRCTIVSIFPRLIDEKKPVWPERFIIAPGNINSPSLTIVEPASCWREIDADQPLVEIPISSVQIAHSVIYDYCVGMNEVVIGTRQPGLFYVEGAYHDLDVLLKLPNYNLMYQAAINWQENWYKSLVAQADVDWARTQGNPLSISLDAKNAAEFLQLKEKAWMKDHFSYELTNCPGCGVMRNPNFPICANCKLVLDEDKFKALGMKLAQ